MKGLLIAGRLKTFKSKILTLNPHTQQILWFKLCAKTAICSPNNARFTFNIHLKHLSVNRFNIEIDYVLRH